MKLKLVPREKMEEKIWEICKEKIEILAKLSKPADFVDNLEADLIAYSSVFVERVNLSDKKAPLKTFKSIVLDILDSIDVES